MSGGPFCFPPAPVTSALLRFVRPLAVVLAGALVAGCGLFRPPPSPAERLAAASQRLAEAPSDSARRALAVGLLREAGLTPVAGDQYGYGAKVVAGLVPGRTPFVRDTLVVVAAGIDSPAAVPLAEAGRRLVDAADKIGAEPGRSVLVALWGAGRTPDAGLADVLAFPLWPREMVRTVLVVGVQPSAGTTRGVPVRVVSSAGDAPGFALAGRIAEEAFAAATAPRFAAPSDIAPDTLQTLTPSAE